MDTKELKRYIQENDFVETILNEIGCHHVKYHSSGGYWTCANKTGDNVSAISVYDTDNLTTINYTRKMTKTERTNDIIDLVSYTCDFDFIQSISFICELVGISVYHDFYEELPESFKILKLIDGMDSGNNSKSDDEPIRVRPNSILNYYRNYTNDYFYNDHISYMTQKEFGIGYDPESNRITIPIYSEFGDLIGVKGRWFGDGGEVKNKYIYLESCPKSKILFGLNKTLPYIKRYGKVYVFESEKSVMQCWSAGIYNTVAISGKKISQYQIDMLIRTGSDIVLCMDKDVLKEEVEEIASGFPDQICVYCMYDYDGLLEDKMSPSDNMDAFKIMEKNIMRLK